MTETKPEHEYFPNVTTRTNEPIVLDGVSGLPAWMANFMRRVDSVKDSSVNHLYLIHVNGVRWLSVNGEKLERLG